MMVYNIEFYAYIPEICTYFFFISIKGRIRIRIFFTAGSGFVFFFSRIRIHGKISDPHS